MTNAPVYRIELPNPFFEGRTNAYVLPGDPLTLIDTGIGTDESFRALEQGFRAHGLALTDVRQIVLTHHHIDHSGQAWRLRELCGAPVYVHHADHEAVTRCDVRLPEIVGHLRFLLTQAGVPAATVEGVLGLYGTGVGRLTRSVPAEPLDDGQRLPAPGGELEVIHVPGHTLGCVCLHWGGYLFSGDHVLPGITPNIGSDLAGGGLLQRYLASLRRVRPLDGLRVLPGHGEEFTDLRGRVDALIAHHDRREEALLELLRSGGPQTVHQLATRLFGELNGFHVVLGVAEAWAHLEKLTVEERVRRDGPRFGAV